MLRWLGFASQHDGRAHNIAHASEHAAVVGSRRVGRTKTPTLEERAALAARSYIRHRYTHYELQLEAVEAAELGDDDSLDIDHFAGYREIRREAHGAVDEFLERHGTRAI